MTNFIDSVFAHFEQRLKTQFYSIFAFWWVVLHGQFFYALLFEDADKIYEKTGLLKSEYLSQHYLDYQYLDFWIEQILLFLLALLLTYLMIWVIPKYVLIHAYNAEKEHEFAKRTIRLQLERKTEQLNTKVEEQVANTRQATVKKVEAEKAIAQTDPSVLWEEEYQQLKTSDINTNFDELIRCLYKFNGQINESGASFRLDRDVLAYADSNNLIDFDREAQQISLNEKGKYFVKRYIADN